MSKLTKLAKQLDVIFKKMQASQDDNNRLAELEIKYVNVEEAYMREYYGNDCDDTKIYIPTRQRGLSQ